MDFDGKRVREISQQGQEQPPVRIRFDYRTAARTPIHHVVPGAGVSDAQGARHSGSLTAQMYIVKTRPCTLCQDATLYALKPTCTTCKTTLSLLKDSGEEFEAVNYYEVPLTAEKLRELLVKLGMSARDVLRGDEPLARSMGLAERRLPDDELIKIMVENPDLIQRPIVVRGDKAVLCRPAENVKKLL